MLNFNSINFCSKDNILSVYIFLRNMYKYLNIKNK